MSDTHSLISQFSSLWKRYKWFLVSCLILGATFLVFTWLKTGPPRYTTDSWLKSAIAQGQNAQFQPLVQHRLPNSDFSPVKDEADASAEKLLESRTFLRLSDKQARAMSLNKLKFTKEKHPYLMRGVYFTWNPDDPLRGFLVFKSKDSVLVEQSAWGHATQMKRKAVVALLDFTPSSTYCDTGITR